MENFNVRDVSHLSEQMSKIDLDCSMEEQDHQSHFDLNSLENHIQQMSVELGQTKIEDESIPDMIGDTHDVGLPYSLGNIPMNHELQGYFDSYSFWKDSHYYTIEKVSPMHLQLNQSELYKLRDIDDIFDEEPEISLNIQHQVPSNALGFAIDSLANFARRIPAFREISATGQTILLQSSIFEILIIQTTTNCTDIITDFEMEMWILNCPDSRGVKPDLSRIFTSEIIGNRRATNMIILIVLFSMKDGHVFSENDSRIINEYYDFVKNILKRLMESTYGYNADRSLNHMSESMEKLNKIAKDMKRVYSCYELA